MNNSRADQESFRTLQLMAELEFGEQLSQRELANRLGIAVGLVNSYLKNFVSKGWVRIKNYPRNRYAYLLTPKGVAEKSRLAYQHLHYFNNLYTAVRKDYSSLFLRLKKRNINEVIFCGVDEVAEIAYLSLQEVGLSLHSVLDPEFSGQNFFGKEVLDLKVSKELTKNCDSIPVIISSLKRKNTLKIELAKYKFDEIFYI